MITGFWTYYHRAIERFDDLLSLLAEKSAGILELIMTASLLVFNLFWRMLEKLDDWQDVCLSVEPQAIYGSAGYWQKKNDSNPTTESDFQISMKTQNNFPIAKTYLPRM